MNKTRSGLVPATIKNLSTGDEVPCMFNPQEYTLSKQNSFVDRPNIGRNTPESSFKQGSSQTLQLNLHFDTLEEQKDVRSITDTLWLMMMVDEDKKKPKTKMTEPPMVAFEWGRFYFKAVISSMTQKFTLFLQDGTPVRCEVQLSLEQKDDELDYKKGDGPAPLMRESAGEVVAKESDRIDNLAASAGVDQRQLAEENNIDNPLNIASGARLSHKG